MKKLRYLFLIFLLASCNQTIQQRQYTEIIIEPKPENVNIPNDDPHAFLRTHPSLLLAENMQQSQFQNAVENSVAQINLIWRKPNNWSEVPGTGMRLVTFYSNGPYPVECSIVSLGGMAGGVRSNITRWLGQINTNVSENEVDQFIVQSEMIKTEGGFQARIFDMTKLQNDDAAQSMISAIVDVGDKTVFVKMTGVRASLQGNLDQFIELTRSLDVEK